MSLESANLSDWGVDDWEDFHNECARRDRYPVWRTRPLPNGDLHIEIAKWQSGEETRESLQQEQIVLGGRYEDSGQSFIVQFSDMTGEGER